MPGDKFSEAVKAWAEFGQEIQRTFAKLAPVVPEPQPKQRVEEEKEPERPAFNRYRALIDNDR